MHISNYGSLILFHLFLFFGLIEGYSQNIKIELGPGEIGANEIFTIAITIENGKISEYDKFPEIPGFTKSGTSPSSSTNIINGKRSSSHSIIQNYFPSGEGEYTLKPFYMTINGDIYSSPGKKIKVGPGVQKRRSGDPFTYDPFEDFFGRQEEQEFIELEDDAFFALSVDKDQVYVGEGINIVLAFYISDKNEAPLHFYDIGRQLSEILKKMKPANCWEENFNIDNINESRVVINNKEYSQYKIYQASFFPFNSEPVEFPSLGLQMIKYKVAKRPNFFGQNKQEDFKTYYSKPKTVAVKELPAHPLKDKVSVGIYKLIENIPNMDISTDESFTYTFNISGEGNIANINPPIVTAKKNIEFYDPNSTSNIRKSNNKVHGNKAFTYYGIPKEPGIYNLNEYFSWVFFNPQSHQYDTLKSTVTLNVTGESKRDNIITMNDLGDFYDKIELEDNNLISRKTDDYIKMFANIFILSMLVLSAIFIFRK